MNGNVAPSLRALLTRLIDYAGMFPPATLSRQAAIDNYKSYRGGEYGWILRWLVVGAAEVAHLPRELDGSLAVLSEADNARAAVLETKTIIAAKKPTYCEVPIGDLERVQRAGGFAKLRTGSV